MFICSVVGLYWIYTTSLVWICMLSQGPLSPVARHWILWTVTRWVCVQCIWLLYHILPLLLVRWRYWAYENASKKSYNGCAWFKLLILSGSWDNFWRYGAKMLLCALVLAAFCTLISFLWFSLNFPLQISCSYLVWFDNFKYLFQFYSLAFRCGCILYSLYA